MHAFSLWWAALSWSQSALIVAVVATVLSAGFLAACARFPWNEPRE